MSLILDNVDHESTVEELLFAILIELRISNNYSSDGFGEQKTEEDLDDDGN